MLTSCTEDLEWVHPMQTSPAGGTAHYMQTIDTDCIPCMHACNTLGTVAPPSARDGVTHLRCALSSCSSTSTCTWLTMACVADTSSSCTASSPPTWLVNPFKYWILVSRSARICKGGGKAAHVLSQPALSVCLQPVYHHTIENCST